MADINNDTKNTSHSNLASGQQWGGANQPANHSGVGDSGGDVVTGELENDQQWEIDEMTAQLLEADRRLGVFLHSAEKVKAASAVAKKNLLAKLEGVKCSLKRIADLGAKK